MSDTKRTDTTSIKDNIVSFQSKAGAQSAYFSLNDAEAFCIQTDEIYYISVIYQDRKGRYHSHGHAVFKSGEKVKFTIAVNDDEMVREKCLKAGHRIAREFGTTLMTGKIDEYGKFHPNTNTQKGKEIKCGKS